MLRIKTNLCELSKFGFVENNNAFAFTDESGSLCAMKPDGELRLSSKCRGCPIFECAMEKLYDLIKAGLVEKGEQK